MIDIPDFTQTIFIHAQYLNYVFIAVSVIGLLFIIYSLRIWALHKKFGGYKHAKSLAQKTKTGIDGPLRLAVKTVLVTLIALLLGLTLLGPKIKENRLENEYEPAQIVIAMDVTPSMLAEDVAPSRLAAAKSAVYNVMERLKKEGNKDKVGLIRFTDIAIPAVIIPTKDYALVEYELRLTTSNYLKLFETHGTNIWDAVTQGMDMFSYLEDQVMVLVIISDGEQVAESDYIDQTRLEAINKRFSDSRFQAVKIFIIGIGNGNEPALIPKEKDEDGKIIEFYAQTEGPDKGTLVTTSPDISYLDEVANLVDGKLIPSKNTEELNKNMEEILGYREVVGVNEKVGLKDMSPWFIGATLVLLFFIPIVRLG